PLNSDGHLMADEFDVSQAFHDMQISIPGRLWKYTLGNHVHLALVASHILLLSPHHYPYDLAPFFTDAGLVTTVRCIQSKYKLTRDSMPLELMKSMVEILDNLDKHLIDRDAAIFQLMLLKLDERQRQIRDAIINLIHKLPDAALNRGLREMEQNTRFVEPFLCGLFNNPSQGVFFRWLDECTMEVKKKDLLTNVCPEITITRSRGVHWMVSSAYREAKPTVESDSNLMLCSDLMRVAIFCKNALDEYGMDVVGNTVSFYVMTLPFAGLYMFYELAAITVPNSIRDLSKLIMDMPQLFLLLDVFHRLCQRLYWTTVFLSTE
ncbi:hypothetical protein BD408DRAFT_457270, partial [Parasitella parasitica]